MNYIIIMQYDANLHLIWYTSIIYLSDCARQVAFLCCSFDVITFSAGAKIWTRLN